MIKKYNNISLVVGIPGFILQFVGLVSQNSLVVLFGTIILVVGFAFYAKAKNRSFIWGAVGCLGFLGLLILALLKDKSSVAVK